MGNRYRIRPTVLALLALAVSAGPAAAGVIYDGTLGTHPSSQGWMYGTDPLVGVLATRSLPGGGSALATTARRSDSAGYFKVYGGSAGVPSLDRSAGFSLDFTLRIDAEEHGGAADLNHDGVADRGGYSVIVVTSDKKALELAFWSDQVWAYADQSGGTAFTHAESAALNTAQLLDYSLGVSGDHYWLRVGGSNLLSGLLRDYSFFGFPYSTANLLFMGDDTSSASSQSFLARAAVSPFSVPLPPTWALLGAGLLGPLVRRLRSAAVKP
jgi:hypothetical protein